MRPRGRFEAMNTGGSLYFGERAGWYDDTLNNKNTLIGFESGYNNTFGELNTAVGKQKCIFTLFADIPTNEINYPISD